MSIERPDPARLAVARTTALSFPLDELAAILVDGPDGTEFLHGQFSSDVKALRPGDAQWSSYNSAKGRMLANFRLWRRPEPAGPAAYAMLAGADVAAAVAKRLAMFVLRSKVKVAVAPALAIVGVEGPAAASAVAGVGPMLVPSGGGVVDLGPGAAGERFALLVPADTLAGVRAALALVAPAGTAADGHWLRVAAGVPLVGSATADRLVAQTANWDALGGINFQKGCYPGQEIVARTQYLGRLKERLFAFHVDADPPAPGTSLYGPLFGDQACGVVVDAVPEPDAGSRLLAVAQITAVAGGGLRLGAVDGPALAPVALPYPIPEAAAPRVRKL